MDKNIASSLDFSKKGRVHFIGIAGSAIAPIALMMRDVGWEVSGSDLNVWEPALSLLNNAGIRWSEGYNASNVKGADLVVVGGAPLMGDAQNPEFVEAKQRGVPMISFPILIGEYITKEKSIVVSGSYGKSTTSSLIAKILDTADVDPSYMIGGKPVDFESGVKQGSGRYSVVEGDEFVASFGFDMEPKFMYYKPKFTVVTAAKWDHLNVYPTEQSYVESYLRLAKLTAANRGELIICASGDNNEAIAEQYSGELISYMIEGAKNRLAYNPEYLAKNIRFDADFTRFEILHGDESLGEFMTPLIGLHNVENSLAAFVTCYEADIEIESIRAGLKNFGGIKRRQELVGLTTNGAIVMDDFAHSPIKAKSTLEAIRSRYKNDKVIVVYMPRMSERGDRKVLEWYQDAFTLADVVIIPKITVKKSTPKEERIRGIDLVNAINKGKHNAIYMPLDSQITNYINENADKNTLVVFMSAGGWGDTMKSVII